MRTRARRLSAEISCIFFMILCMGMSPALTNGQTIAQKSAETNGEKDRPDKSQTELRKPGLSLAELESVAPSLGPDESALLRNLLFERQSGVVAGGKKRTAPMLLEMRDAGSANWADIYRKTAPSVVLIFGDVGAFGTGFVVRNGGWILTNHHVVSMAQLNKNRNRTVDVFFGKLDEYGVPQCSEHFRTAIVYKWDEDLDLALLKLEGDEDSLKREELPPPLKFTRDQKTPHSGDAVCLIGHADIGMLWAAKFGEVSTTGTLLDSKAFVVAELHKMLKEGGEDASLSGFKETLKKSLPGYVNTTMIQASLSASPGDSGGPLMDSDGEVVGICSSLKADKNQPVTVDFFVHHKEIAAFLAEIPATPIVELSTDIWNAGAAAYTVRDFSGEDAKGFMFGLDSELEPRVVALDADRDTDIEKYRRQSPHEVAVQSTYAIPGSERFISIYEDGQIIANDVSQSIVWSLESKGQVTCSAVSPDGKLGVVGFLDGETLLFDAERGAAIWRKTVHEATSTAVTFTPDSTSFWTGTATGKVTRVSLEGEALSRMTFEKSIQWLDASRDGKWLAIAESEGPVHLYDIAKDKAIQLREETAAYQVRFHPNGKLLLVSPGESSNSLFVFSTKKGDLVRKIELESSPLSFALSPDGKHICVETQSWTEYVILKADSGEKAGNRRLGGEEADQLPALLRALVHTYPRNFVFSTDRLFLGGLNGELYSTTWKENKETETVEPFFNKFLVLDQEQMASDHAFDAEVAIIFDPSEKAAFLLYDLNNDGVFERIRIDNEADGIAEAEFVARDGSGPYEQQKDFQPGPACLPIESLPESWREAYAEFVKIVTT